MKIERAWGRKYWVPNIWGNNDMMTKTEIKQEIAAGKRLIQDLEQRYGGIPKMIRSEKAGIKKFKELLQLIEADQARKS